jgi:Mg/Co/Ni transporter MgtE
LSTRAISHLQVAKSNYTKWLIDEIQVAATLGVAMGAAIGTIAFQMSGFDAFFGIVVFLANALAVRTSGLTGTIAPLLFTFFFHREEEKWNSLLATALQDVIGFFSMIFCVAGCYWLFSSDDQDSSCL